MRLTAGKGGLEQEGARNGPAHRCASVNLAAGEIDHVENDVGCVLDEQSPRAERRLPATRRNGRQPCLEILGERNKFLLQSRRQFAISAQLFFKTRRQLATPLRQSRREPARRMVEVHNHSNILAPKANLGGTRIGGFLMTFPFPLGDCERKNRRQEQAEEYAAFHSFIRLPWTPARTDVRTYGRDPGAAAGLICRSNSPNRLSSGNSAAPRASTSDARSAISARIAAKPNQ